MAQKSNIRSMRFSNEIMEMIESQTGETFTAKFENLVQRCMWELPKREEELKRINDQIEYQKKRLSRIQDQANEIESQFNNFKYSMQNMQSTIDIAINKLSKTINEP